MVRALHQGHVFAGGRGTTGINVQHCHSSMIHCTVKMNSPDYLSLVLGHGPRVEIEAEGGTVTEGAATCTLERAGGVHEARILGVGRETATAEALRAHLKVLVSTCNLETYCTKGTYDDEGLDNVVLGRTTVGEPPAVGPLTVSLLGDCGGQGTSGEESKRGELDDLHFGWWLLTDRLN